MAVTGNRELRSDSGEESGETATTRLRKAARAQMTQS